MKVVASLRDCVIHVNNVEGGAISIHNVEDYRVKVCKVVVSVELDGVSLEECLPSVDGDLAHVSQGVF